MTDASKYRVKITDYKEEDYKVPELDSLKLDDKYIILRGKNNPVEYIFQKRNRKVINSLIENNKVRIKK